MTSLLTVMALTLALEYALHHAKLFDNLVAVEIIEDVGRALLRRTRAQAPP